MGPPLLLADHRSPQADEKASKLQAEWLARFAEQREAMHARPLEQVSAELAATLAQSIRASVLARDDLAREC